MKNKEGARARAPYERTSYERALVGVIVVAVYVLAYEARPSGAQVLVDTNVPAYNCNCIAFRLDDIQDYYVSVPQRALLDLFQMWDYPLTIGVIGGKFGYDSYHARYIRDKLRSPWGPKLEVAVHGLYHEDFSELTYAQQYALLSESMEYIKGNLSVKPLMTFIPPYNEFNLETLYMLKDLKLTHMTSQTELDFVRPYPLIGQSLYRFPIGASTNDAANEMVFIGITAEQMIAQIQDQLATDGYCAMMMHPMEFAVQDAIGLKYNSINQTMMGEISKVLKWVTEVGLRVVPVARLNVDAPDTPVDMWIPMNETDDIKPEFECGCVAFRFDNIQDYYQADIVKEVLTVLYQQYVPLTLGAISNYLTEDKPLIKYLQSFVHYTNSEVACNGLNFEDFSTFSAADQLVLLQQCSSQLQKLFSNVAPVFLPPLENFNNDTLIALEMAGYKVLSSDISTDQAPYGNLHKTVKHYPFAMSFGEAQTLDELTSILDNYYRRDGFVVIQITAGDFAYLDNTTWHLNLTTIDRFIKFIWKIRENYDIVLLSQVGPQVTGPALGPFNWATTGTPIPTSEPPPVSSSTTGPLKTSTTGRAAPVAHSSAISNTILIIALATVGGFVFLVALALVILVFLHKRPKVMPWRDT